MLARRLCVFGLLLVSQVVAFRALGAPTVTCGSTQCVPPSSKCSDGACSLRSPEYVFPTLELSEISVVEPGDLATASSTPSMSWVFPVGTSIVAAAILRLPPTYDAIHSDAIANAKDVVWIWNSRMPSADPSWSTASFGSGSAVVATAKNVLDDTSMTGKPPPPLSPGVYYWAVWAWTGSPPQLSHRSRLRAFVVAGENITGAPCGNACGAVAATRCVSGGPVGDYCVIACAADEDCFGGEKCDLSVASDPNHPWGICRATPACQCAQGELCTSLNVCARATVAMSARESDAESVDAAHSCSARASSPAGSDSYCFVLVLVGASVGALRRAKCSKSVR